MNDPFPISRIVFFWISVIGLGCVVATAAYGQRGWGIGHTLLGISFLAPMISTLVIWRAIARARRTAVEHGFNLCTKCEHPLPVLANLVPPPHSGESGVAGGTGVGVSQPRPRPLWTCTECGRLHAEGEAQEHWRRVY